jgi:hypothetical protein
MTAMYSDSRNASTPHSMKWRAILAHEFEADLLRDVGGDDGAS